MRGCADRSPFAKAGRDKWKDLPTKTEAPAGTLTAAALAATSARTPAGILPHNTRCDCIPSLLFHTQSRWCAADPVQGLPPTFSPTLLVNLFFLRHAPMFFAPHAQVQSTHSPSCLLGCDSAAVAA